MVMWVCEASEVNNLTVLAVGPNHRDKDDKDKDKIASSGSDPPKGSDKNVTKYGLLPNLPLQCCYDINIKLFMFIGMINNCTS